MVTDVAADAVAKAGDVHFEAAAEAGGRVLNAARADEQPKAPPDETGTLV